MVKNGALGDDLRLTSENTHSSVIERRNAGSERESEIKKVRKQTRKRGGVAA